MTTSVSVGHGPGTPRNEGTAQDRGTPVPDSNLTEIDATQESGHKKPGSPRPDSDKETLLPGAKSGPAPPL